VLFLSKRIPLLNAYDDRGSFFVRVPVDALGNLVLPTPRYPTREELNAKPDQAEQAVPIYRGDWFVQDHLGHGSSGVIAESLCGVREKSGEEAVSPTAKAVDPSSGLRRDPQAPKPGRADMENALNTVNTGSAAATGESTSGRKDEETGGAENSSSASSPVVPPIQGLSSAQPPIVGTELRCTMLFVVVLCLEVTDVLFAVDSVSAIVAQIDDLYLAYTACIFAMLGT